MRLSLSRSLGEPMLLPRALRRQPRTQTDLAPRIVLTRKRARSMRAERAAAVRGTSAQGLVHETSPTREAEATPNALDADVSRVRAAGGPEDAASYTCSCGFYFTAPVSTTVRCPHCDATQVW